MTEPVEQVTPDMLLGIIGAKEVEIQVLRGKLARLELDHRESLAKRLTSKIFSS